MTRAEIQRLLRSHVTRQEGKIADFSERVYRLFDNALTDALKEFQTGELNQTQVAAKLGTIGRELETLGFSKATRAFLAQSYKAELEMVQNYFFMAGKGKGLDVFDVDAAKTLAELDFEKINQTLARELGTIRGQVMRQVIMGETLDIRALRDSLGKKTASYIESEVRTGTQAFSRAVMVKKGKESFGENPRFLYVGPLDKITRDWCTDVLERRSPPIYTLKEIEALPPGPGGLDPMIYGGGYNCRHTWTPVSEYYEE